MAEILKSKSKGLSAVIVLKDRSGNCSDATELKEVNYLKRVGPSVFAGGLPACMKIVSLSVPLMDALMHLNIAVEFWMARISFLFVYAVATAASVTEW